MKIDIPRKVIGSLTGEVWESRGKVPRRKLPEGRTETGREIPNGHPEYEGDPKEEEGETIEIVVEESEEEELDFQPAGTIDFEPVAIEIEDAPEIPEQFETGPQAPRTTKQDADKLQDLMMGIACLFDDKTYSTEDKAIIISKLFADTTNVRVETAQYVMSARTYGLCALTVSVALLLKGSSGLFSNYRNAFNFGVGQNPQEEPDVFGETDGQN